MTARQRIMDILMIIGLFATLTACGRTPVSLMPNDAGPSDDASCDPSCYTICAKTAIPCGLDSKQAACATRCAQDPMSPEFRCLRDLACQSSISCTLVRACPSAPRLTDFTIRSFTAVARDRAFIDYRIQICNQGNQDANNVELALYLARESAPRPKDIRDFLTTIPSMPRGQCHIIHTQLITHRAAVRSWAFVDPNQRITESNESNNIAGPLAINLNPESGPDLEVTSFDAYPDKGSVIFAAKVCNVGSQTTSGSTHIDFYENSVSPPSTSTPPSLSKLVPSLAPKQCYLVKTHDPLSPGSYHSWAYINRTHAVAESSFANNLSKRRDFVIGTGNDPDLYIKTFDIYTWQKSATYLVTVCNHGNIAVVNTAFEIFHQKTPPSQTSPAARTVSVPWMVAGSCESFKTTLSLNVGNYVAWAWINRRNKPAEGNTKNNLAGPKSFTIRDPSPTIDLSIKSFKSQATSTGDTAYTVEVCNTGLARTPTSEVAIYFNLPTPPKVGTPGDQNMKVSSLPPGVCSVLTTSATLASGSYVSWALVDPQGLLKEMNETNNIGGPLSLTVGTPSTACDKACSTLVSPCNFLPKGQLNACITNCQSLPQSKIDCVYKATVLGKCSAIDHCLF